MLALTAMLLTTGPALALAGLLGFTVNLRVCPHPDDLSIARATAFAGQIATGLGLLELWSGPLKVGGALGAGTTLATAIAVLSLLTRLPIPHHGDEAGPRDSGRYAP